MLSTLKQLVLFSRQRSKRGHRCFAGTLARFSNRPRRIDLGGTSPDDIDAAFCGLVLGVQSPTDSYLNNYEKTVLRELDRLLSADNLDGSNFIPRLPEMIPLVMGSLDHRSSSFEDLISRLNDDPVLVSRLIQLANSPFYTNGTRITDLEQAVSCLGRVGIRQLVANIAFKPLIHLRAGHFSALSGATLWELAEKAAIACDCMARQEKTDRFKAYLIALMGNIGLTVALQVLDRKFDGGMVPRSQSFHQCLIRQARILSLLIAREWAFPAIILDALEAQIDGHPGDTLGSILYAGDKLSKLHTLETRGRFKGGTEAVTRRLHGSVTDAFKACYSSVGE